MTRILAIETSCDETAISILEVLGEVESPVFHILADKTHSQVAVHEAYGGVFPKLAKREHAINLPLVLVEVLKQAQMHTQESQSLSLETQEKLKEILEREEGFFETIFPLLENLQKPNIDKIALTVGPGLAPALWVGISFAKALSLVWNIPIVAVNHMEGHFLSVLLDHTKESSETINISKIEFPILGLLISGGHTELVLAREFGKYEKIGQTVDDAVGEAFDKVARVLELPYPGGPRVSLLAKQGVENPEVSLPRPMLHSGDFNFSFSGLKTAVLYLSQKLKTENKWSEQIRSDIAREFEHSVAEVLITKTKKAIKEYGIETLIVAGGVSANEFLQKEFHKLNTDLLLPRKEFTGDNAVMIAIASYFETLKDSEEYQYNTPHKKSPDEIKALGNWSI